MPTYDPTKPVPRRVINLTGQVFGRLTVQAIHPHPAVYRSVKWDCVCECGKSCTIFGVNLRLGKTKSCGCLRSDFSKNNCMNNPKVRAAQFKKKEAYGTGLAQQLLEVQDFHENITIISRKAAALLFPEDAT